MRKWSGAVIGALAAASLGTAALADGYLTIDGITVPAADTSDPGWMKVLSYSVDTTAPANNASGAGAGKPSTSTVQITRNQDAVSPELFSATAAGKLFQLAALDVPAADGSQMVYKFANVKITNDQVSSGQGGAPQETLTLSYASMQEVDVSTTIRSNGAMLRIPPLTASLVRSPVLAPSASTPASGKPRPTATVPRAN